MKATKFDLARMRPIALLGLWFRLHPYSHDMDARRAWLHRLTSDQIAALIIEASRART